MCDLGEEYYLLVLYSREEIEPIGQGPVFNPLGKADVESSLSGRYSITADDINFKKTSVNVPESHSE